MQNKKYGIYYTIDINAFMKALEKYNFNIKKVRSDKLNLDISFANFFKNMISFEIGPSGYYDGDIYYVDLIVDYVSVSTVIKRNEIDYDNLAAEIYNINRILQLLDSSIFNESIIFGLSCRESSRRLDMMLNFE